MKNYLTLYIIGILMGSTPGVAASFIDLNSYEIVLLRSVIGGLFVAVLFFGTGHRLSVYRNKRDVLFITASGICLAVNWLLLYEAFTLIGVSMATIINFCAPIIVVILSPLIFHERLTFRKVSALALTVAGVMLISGQALNQGHRQCGASVGDSAHRHTLFFAFRGGFHFQIQTGDWLPILWVALIGTAASNLLFFSNIGRLPAQTVAICGYIEPVSAAILSAVILKESMTPVQIFGAVMIIGGALWGECRVKKGIKKERITF